MFLDHELLQRTRTDKDLFILSKTRYACSHNLAHARLAGRLQHLLIDRPYSAENLQTVTAVSTGQSQTPPFPSSIPCSRTVRQLMLIIASTGHTGCRSASMTEQNHPVTSEHRGEPYDSGAGARMLRGRCHGQFPPRESPWPSHQRL
jgi:hypothetical protein